MKKFFVLVWAAYFIIPCLIQHSFALASETLTENTENLPAGKKSISPAVYSSPESIWAFAEHLFAEEEYYRAITEYKRLLFLFPRHSLKWKARLRIGECYQKGEKWEEAIAAYRKLQSRLKIMAAHPPSSAILHRELFYKTGECYYSLGEYWQARQALEELITGFPENEEFTDKARYLIGRCYLAESKWRDAGAEFSKLRQAPNAQELSRKARQGDDLPSKSPWKAGLLSAVLPGLGQLYVGRKQDAAVAFTLNAVFIWAAYEAFQNDDDAVGGILAFFELGWYTGNIYSATSSAHKYNRDVEDNFRREIEDQFSFSFGSHSGSLKKPFFTFTYHF